MLEKSLSPQDIAHNCNAAFKRTHGNVVIRSIRVYFPARSPKLVEIHVNFHLIIEHSTETKKKIVQK